MTSLLICTCQISRAQAVDGVPCNPHATAGAKKLLKYLYKLSNDKFNGVIAGQNFTDDVSEGYTTGYDHYFVKPYRAAGKWIGMITVDPEYSYEAPLSQLLYVNETLEQHWRKGGLVTVGWSPTNPTGGEIGGIGTQFNLDRLITPGDPLYPIWMAKLNRMAAMLKDLQDKKVVVIWRPMQEMTNPAGFWWSKKAVTDTHSDYVDVWRHMYKYFTVTKGLNNLLWAWAPTGTATRSSFPYPGDSYVDIVAATIYNNDLSQYRYWGYPDDASFYPRKVIALSEFGPWDDTGNFDNTNYVKAIKQYFPKLAYWSTWDNWKGHLGAIGDNLKVSELLNDPGIIDCPVPGGTSPVKDTVPPSIPGALRIKSITPNSVTMTWTAATDNDRVKGYDVFYNRVVWPPPVTRANKSLGSITSLSYTVTGLTPKTNYAFCVRAVDATDNTGCTCDTVMATTTDGPPAVFRH